MDRFGFACIDFAKNQCEWHHWYCSVPIFCSHNANAQCEWNLKVNLLWTFVSETAATPIDEIALWRKRNNNNNLFSFDMRHWHWYFPQCECLTTVAVPLFLLLIYLCRVERWMIMRPIGLSIVMVDQREFTRENTMVCAPYWARKTCTYTVGKSTPFWLMRKLCYNGCLREKKFWLNFKKNSRRQPL